MNVSSPCIQVCKLDNRNICIGCHRTRDEIARWLQMSESKKLHIVRRVERQRVACECEMIPHD